jgi:DHA1 family solute carrier family 18 vesicular amine transporter 1/2
MKMRESPVAAVALVTLATFTDLLAYSICVPVLPDFASRLGASATTIGLLFASFGVTLLAVSVPLGAFTDRVGRKVPLVAGMLALAGATLVFARADTLPLLAAARMIQGAADGVTWIAGFALIADLYAPEERGRVMGYVMSGTSSGLMIGPSIGGWLYQAGGVSLPFLFVSLLAIVCAIGFVVIRPRIERTMAPGPSVLSVIAVPAVAACALFVIVCGATMAMLEPMLPLFFSQRLGLSPAEIGLLFGVAAVASTVLPFVFGPMADRWGGRPLAFIGLVCTAAWMPMMSLAVSFRSALALIIVQWIWMALIATPSLAYMAETTSFVGGGAYGVGYGVYNAAWAVGLLAGPAAGGWLFERLGFRRLTVGWSIAVILIAAMLWRLRPVRT